LRTKNLKDLETLIRRPLYLAQFVSDMLRNHKGAGDDQDLTEAQLVVDELKQLQPEQLNTLKLQVAVYKACNQLDKAADLIQTAAKRSDLAPIAVGILAELAEKLDRFDIAEPLYRRYALLKPRDGAIVAALFLGRNGHIKDALDLCEPLWANPETVEGVAKACVEVVISSNAPPDQVQVDRVAGWLEQAIKQKRDSTLLLAALGNCRERQTRYDDAKTLYESVIKQGPGNAVTNKMIADSYNNLAWLLALTGSQVKDALVDINQAIKLEGPGPEYLDTRGIIYLSLKRTQDAINDLEIAVKADPSSPSKLFHLTQAYLQANNKERARHYWKYALDKKLDQIRFGPRGLHPLEQLAYQKVRGELGSP
jgi:tetratricopeptide (TPR) repeat protein